MSNRDTGVAEILGVRAYSARDGTPGPKQSNTQTEDKPDKDLAMNLKPKDEIQL